jgi:ssDNA thymidine ADP-ribosyltransferase, DarT
VTIEEQIVARAIEEVVHFTTNHGCLGTIYTNKLQSRHRLSGDPMVEYLFKPNAELRKDTAYLDHVSLSIGHLNHQFYGVSAGSWHRDEPIFWCILAFDPVIMAHPGTVFATTNNIYTGVLREEGENGLEALYANQITRWYGNSVVRPPSLPAAYPTCFQAEILYPQSVSTDHLIRIYVQTQSDQSEVVGFLKATFHRDVDVIVDPSKFGPRPL